MEPLGITILESIRKLQTFNDNYEYGNITQDIIKQEISETSFKKAEDINEKTGDNHTSLKIQSKCSSYILKILNK